MGTYVIIYPKKSEMAEEINNLLKKRYNLEYKVYNGVEYGTFFTQKMFDEDLRFMNEDEEGKPTSYTMNVQFPKKPIICCYSEQEIVLAILEPFVSKSPLLLKKIGKLLKFF